MSQKEQIAKIAENYGLGQDIKMDPRVWKFRPEERSMRALEAAFLLGARAMQEKAVESIPDRYFFTKEWIKKFKPEELL